MKRPARDWVDEEVGARAAWLELRRLLRRARYRWGWSLGITLFLVLGLVGQRARKLKIFESKIIFRITEGDVDPGTAPPPNVVLRSYVKEVVFSNERLIALLKKYEIGLPLLARDPIEAASDLREDIEVEVWRNYFIGQRQSDEAARSARMSIAYNYKDPQVAYDLVRDLGRLVREAQQARAVADAKRVVDDLQAAEDVAREELLEIDSRVSEKRLQLAGASPVVRAQLGLEIKSEEKRLEEVGKDLQRFQQNHADYEMRMRLEESRLGVQFELVDAGEVQRLRMSKLHELARLGVIVWVMLLPLVALLVGAADSRVYDGGDVRRLGIGALGHVPSFPGDEVGALRSRLERDRV